MTCAAVATPFRLGMATTCVGYLATLVWGKSNQEMNDEGLLPEETARLLRRIRSSDSRRTRGGAATHPSWAIGRAILHSRPLWVVHSFELRDPNMDKTPFYFGQWSGSAILVARIPSGLGSKRELLETLGHSLKFPDYYGVNWDAFEECIRDLS